MPRTIKIFDTTLRDGEQAPGCSMNREEKLEIARSLEALGVDCMEAGFAVSSPEDFRSVQEIARQIRGCSIASLSRCVKKDVDASWEALKEAADPRIHVFIATSPVHMEYKLRMTPEQVLENARATVAYAASLCSNIEFSAEDAMRSDPEFLAKVVEAVIAAGATTVNIPDTVGYTTPEEMYERIRYLMERVPGAHKAAFSVHCHNDLGMASANSLAGVRAGATQIECTVNGLGERAGNTSLEEVVMAIHTRPQLYNAVTNINTRRIYKTSRLIYHTLGIPVPPTKPIVGANAFAHEAGIHQHGVLANRATYEIMTPESVGIPQNSFVLGKHSGRHAFQERLRAMGYELDTQELDRAFEEFKALSDKKKDITSRDLEALVSHREAPDALYALERFDVRSSSTNTSSCIIALKRDGNVIEDVALGDGPVDAAYKAIDKIVAPPEHSFENFHIQSVSEGKDTLGEVTVRLQWGDRGISGRGLSTDIIEASILAYLNAVNKLVDMAGDQG